MASNNTGKFDPDYDLSFDEYNKSQKSSHSEDISNKKVVSDESVGKAPADSDVAAQQSAPIEEQTDSALVAQGMADGYVEEVEEEATVDDAASSVSEAVEGVAEAAKSAFTPGGLMKTGLTLIAQHFGVPARVVTLAIALAGGVTAGAFIDNDSTLSSAPPVEDTCVEDNSLMVYNPKYEGPTQVEKDGYARAMFRMLNSKEISRPWAGDEDFKTSTNLMWYPITEEDVDEDGNPILDEDGNPTGVSKGFSPEAIIGMVANADRESGLMPDSYECNYWVGPHLKEKDTILSTFHHYDWDIYFEQMKTRYSGSVSISEDGYKYTDRLTKEEHYYPGMGLWGFTGPLAYELQEFCDTLDNPWEMNGDEHNDAMYTMSGQLAFVLYGEDWCQYLKSKGKTTEVGTLKLFKVKVPDRGKVESKFSEEFTELGITFDDETTMDEICAAMRLALDYRETHAKVEGVSGKVDVREYDNKKEYDELKKVREKWEEDVETCLSEDKVTAAEWATTNVIYYDVYNWVYFPQKTVDETKVFYNYNIPLFDTTPGNSSIASDMGNGVLLKYEPDKYGPRRVYSDTPLYFDREWKDTHDWAHKTDKDEYDIWLWDMHVEIIARDRFGRILKKVSKEDSEIENGTITSGKTAEGYNDYSSFSLDEGEHTEDNNKILKLVKDDYIRYESRVWSEEEFEKWHKKYKKTYANDWREKYNYYLGMGMPPEKAGELATLYAHGKGLENADEVKKRINKELEFDVRADIGTKEEEGDGSGDGSGGGSGDGSGGSGFVDENSDNDLTSAGGLASEVLAREWSIYFEGIDEGNEDELEKHYKPASHYFEQYLGTQGKGWEQAGSFGGDFFGGVEAFDENIMSEALPQFKYTSVYKRDEEEGWYNNSDIHKWDPDEETYDGKNTNESKFPEKWIWTPNDDLSKMMMELFDREAEKHTNAQLSIMRAENDKTRCGLRFDTSTIASTAINMAWPKGYSNLATLNTTLLCEDGESGDDRAYALKLCTELYVAVKDLVMPEENPRDIDPDAPSKVVLYSSCDRGAMTVSRSSGADPSMPGVLDDQLKYMEESEIWWDVLTDKVIINDDNRGDLDIKYIKSEKDLEKLLPGDFLISGDETDVKHIMVYVGPEAAKAKWPDYFPPDEYDEKAKWSVVHSSNASPNEVKDEASLETSRGLMFDPDVKKFIIDDGQYRIFRCRNIDLASLGPKWAVNAEWVTLSNKLKGEIRNGAFWNMVRYNEMHNRGNDKHDE